VVDPSPSAEHRAAAELRLALRRFHARTEQVTRAHGLTPQRYQLLLLIKVFEEDGATVGRLSKRLWIGQTAVTQLVRRAEDLGLIRRELSSRDARVHHLRLTPEGERRLADALAELGREREMLVAALAEIDSNPCARGEFG
jgi:DNA-binding MarR family transcriptional regulator